MADDLAVSQPDVDQGDTPQTTETPESDTQDYSAQLK